RDRQREEALLLHDRRDTARRVELAQAPLDLDLPDRHGADRDQRGTVLDASPDPRVQRLTAQPPQQRVRVEQQAHRSSNAAITSGGVRSKSGAMETWPRHRPGFRLADASYGTSLATGRPALPMMISSPAAARSTRRDSWDFASCMF